MAETFKKSKIVNFQSLIQIFLDKTIEKYKTPGDSTDKRYLNGQLDENKLVLKIIEKDFEVSPTNSQENQKKQITETLRGHVNSKRYKWKILLNKRLAIFLIVS
jgi:hypothetical protein